MSQRRTAIYRNGALFPLQPLTLPEEAAVEIEIADAEGNSSLLADPAERERMWRQIFDRWDRHPVNGVAGRYTRDELHERHNKC
ncbi:MAG: antitoxin family protein [Pirellulaceae bacterium]